ncbi:MAG: hypothetical protein ACI4GX_06855 [Ruminococcus sp.]
MNAEYYQDEPIIKINPTHIKKQRKPPFVREFEYFSPKLLNRQPTPSGREGYYLYYYMESYYTSRTKKIGDKSIKVYDKHVSKKSVEVTLEQWNALHAGDCKDYRDNRREYEQQEYEPKHNGEFICTLDALLQYWDKFDHEQFWANAFDLERVLNTFSDEDLDIYLYAKEKRLKQKQIAVLIGKSESYVTRRMKYIEEEIEHDLLNSGAYTELQVKAFLEYHRYLRTGKCDSFADVFIYDFLLSMPQEMQIRYLFIFRGQGELIKFCFLWIYEYFNGNGQQNVIAREVLSKYSYQLYKKHAVKLQPWAKQLFIEVELEAEELIKRYGIKDSRPNEKFVKAVQKAATAKGMTVAEYRDKILFLHGQERIIERFKKFIKLHPEMQGKFKPQTKANVSAQSTRAFVSKKR